MIRGFTKFFVLMSVLAMALSAQAETALNEPIASEPIFDNGSEINGGAVVADGDEVASFTVLLVGSKAGGSFICSGAIIAPDVVLTAAHCVAPRTSIVFARSINNISQARVVAAKAAVVHPAYNPSGPVGWGDNHDIAILHFEGGLPAGYTTVAAIADARSLRRGAAVTLAGYGRDNTRGGETGILKKTNVAVANASYNQNEISLSQTGSNGGCFGDSGGPALVRASGRYAIVGVASRTTSNCDQVIIYTKAHSYLEWIRASLRNIRNPNFAHHFALR